MQEQHSCPVTSVIVVTYNSRADIDACLQSVLAHSSHVEIIVVDNMSSDGSLAYIHEHYPDITAIPAGHNGGYGAGVNLGATLARGEYIAVLNPDTRVQPGWLDPLLAVLADREDVGLVTPTILLEGTEDLVNACGNTSHITGLTFCVGLHQPAPPRSAPPRPVSAISGAAFVMRRALWERLGGFDEQFFMYLEDTDLSWRVLRLGYTIMHVSASRVWHDYALRVSATKLYHLEYNRLLLLYRNLRVSTLIMLMPALLLTEMIIWAFCVSKGPSFMRAKARSYLDFIANRRAIRRCSMISSDRILLGALVSRLAIEQLTPARTIHVVNKILTVVYALWHGMAIVGACQ